MARTVGEILRMIRYLRETMLPACELAMKGIILPDDEENDDDNDQSFYVKASFDYLREILQVQENILRVMNPNEPDDEENDDDDEWE